MNYKKVLDDHPILKIFVIVCAGYTILYTPHFGFMVGLGDGTSMLPVVDDNDILVVDTYTDYDSVDVGDIIVFEDCNDQKIMHRVVNETERGLITKGDNVQNVDQISDCRYPVTQSNYIGKMVVAI